MSMFQTPFSFNGRIRRTEYGLSFIAYFVVTKIVDSFVNSSVFFDLSLSWLFYLPLLWILWAQGAKRCHDLGKSGWWQIIPFYFFWMLFQDGQEYENEYGLNPKGNNGLYFKSSSFPPPAGFNSSYDNKGFNNPDQFGSNQNFNNSGKQANQGFNNPGFQSPPPLPTDPASKPEELLRPQGPGYSKGGRPENNQGF